MKTREQILEQLRERLETLTQDEIEKYPKDYYIRTNNGTGYDTGAAATEDVYDRIRAKENVIDNCEWSYDAQFCMLINELLYMI